MSPLLSQQDSNVTTDNGIRRQLALTAADESKWQSTNVILDSFPAEVQAIQMSTDGSTAAIQSAMLGDKVILAVLFNEAVSIPPQVCIL